MFWIVSRVSQKKSGDMTPKGCMEGASEVGGSGLRDWLTEER
jgi:hypothetical protein